MTLSSQSATADHDPERNIDTSLANSHRRHRATDRAEFPAIGLESSGALVSSMELKEKFVAFVDILGFSSHVKAADNGKGLSHADLYAACKTLGSEKDREDHKRGSKICPVAPCIQKDVDFQLTQAADGVVVSTEISPAGVINIVDHCWKVCLRLMTEKGLMCRGYICRGLIHHDEKEFYGPGQIAAVDNEKTVGFYRRSANERGTPFIQVDKEVVAYVTSQTDKCVKDMFGRMTLTHDDVTAIFPIKRLEHSFGIGTGMPKFDGAKEKKGNDKVRKLLIKLKEQVVKNVDTTNPSAVSKSEHYIRAFDEQLAACDVMDRDIEMLQSPFPARTMESLFKKP